MLALSDRHVVMMTLRRQFKGLDGLRDSYRGRFQMNDGYRTALIFGGRTEGLQS